MTEACGMIFSSQIFSRPLTSITDIAGYIYIPINSQYWCHLFFFRAVPVAYGGSHTKGIGAVAAGLYHSHSNARTQLCL